LFSLPVLASTAALHSLLPLLTYTNKKDHSLSLFNYRKKKKVTRKTSQSKNERYSWYRKKKKTGRKETAKNTHYCITENESSSVFFLPCLATPHPSIHPDVCKRIEDCCYSTLPPRYQYERN
jgi:hypothetical protein